MAAHDDPLKEELTAADEPPWRADGQPVARLLAAIAVGIGFIILIAVFVFPPIAANIRERIRVEELATAQSLAATARAPSPVPTGAPTSTPLPPGFQLNSGGIGLDQARWEELHGESGERSGTFLIYSDGRYVVEFLRGRIRYLERAWDPGAFASLDEARLAAAVLLPFDFEEAGAERIGDDTIVERFQSAQLRALLLAEGWATPDAGMITVTYSLSGQLVTRATLQISLPQPPQA
jgi:hypothetical protein